MPSLHGEALIGTDFQAKAKVWIQAQSQNTIHEVKDKDEGDNKGTKKTI